jgi:transcriptional regulator with XRE-family HTH domain
VWRIEHDKLAARLKALREESGLTQREFAAKLGRTQGYVGKVELGLQFVRIVELLSWCEVAGYDPCEVLRDVLNG